jgi:hypothetical protein
MGMKWLELLTQIAPQVNRVAVIYDPDNRSSLGQLPEIETIGPHVAHGGKVNGCLPCTFSEISRALVTTSSASRT